MGLCFLRNHTEREHFTLELSDQWPSNYYGELVPLKSLPSQLLRPSVLNNLFLNLTHLEELSLEGINISSVLPTHLNISSSSLKLLNLRDTTLQGKLPHDIFKLQSLETLDLSDNSFSGDIPWEISLLPKLVSLHLSMFNVIDYLRIQPHTFYSLLKNSTLLKDLSLSQVNIGSVLPSFLNISSVRLLDLSYCGLRGFLPNSLVNLSGNIPFESFALPALKSLDLSHNQFDGQIDLFDQGLIVQAFQQLTNLTRLDLSFNKFKGEWELETLLSSLTNLVELRLSYSGFSVITTNASHYVNPGFDILNLASCKLKVFPESLRAMRNLSCLDLSSNEIHGEIPLWAGEVGGIQLYTLDLSYNFITGFQQFQWYNLYYLYLQSNLIRGPFPPAICNISYLSFLDMSNNNFDGEIPQCFGNIISSLAMINLGNNSFHGTIPKVYRDCAGLEGLILNGNQLQGEIPSSLSKCQSLKVLDLGNNLLNGTFPIWLERLPNLQVLVLKSNKLHGIIETSSSTKLQFQSLWVLDLSHNGFSGQLPQKYFQNFIAMKRLKRGTKPEYLNMSDLYYSITVTVKGQQLPFPKLSVEYVIVDLSSNKFEGEIPNDITSLTSLIVLNLSHNSLTGRIPHAVGNLTEIESLDLSSVAEPGSCTFEGNSFGGNPKLCGTPLPIKCNEHTKEPQLESDGRDEDESGFTWKVVMGAYDLEEAKQEKQCLYLDVKLVSERHVSCVVQYVIQMQIPSAVSKLILEFGGDCVHLSTQKVSSRVCGHCKELTPKFENAASILSSDDPPVVPAKVDANDEKNKDLANEYDIKSFPTLKTLAEKLRSDYEFAHTLDAKLLPRGDTSVSGPLVHLFKPFDELVVDFEAMLFVNFTSKSFGDFESKYHDIANEHKGTGIRFLIAFRPINVVNGGMMDPEMMRLAQEQMSRMSPADLQRIQQQMMSNPELIKMASESMKDMNPEDMRRAAEQLKYTRPDEMAEIGAKMANATPEELASMRSRADAQINYQLNAAQMLKQKGNELHSRGSYSEASEKYLRAKNNLKGILTSKAGTLLLACSLNLMSCYLKTNQFDECIQEGTEVLATDAKNVKALYRRGQAYKSLGQLKRSVSDLTKALEFSPDDETIADVLRDAKEKLTEHGDEDEHTGFKIEDITDEVHETSPSESSAQRTEETSKHMNSQSENTSGTSVLPTNTDYLHALKDKESIRSASILFDTAIVPIVSLLSDCYSSLRSFQNFMSQADPETLASVGGGKLEGISPDMVKTASSMISSMPPDELQRMLEMATSFQENNNPLNNSNRGSGIPNVTPDMLKTATDMMNKMPPEELQNMLNMASSFREQGSTSTNSALRSNGSRLNKDSPPQGRCENSIVNEDIGESSTSRGVSDLRNTPQPSFPGSSDMQEQIKNQMNNPAMREMMSTMMKSMSPDMMANMSEQFGFKLSREDAEKAQQAMSSLTPESIDKMMKWANRIQRTVEGAKSTKNWLLGRQGLAMAVIMLLLAILLNWLGYIGH
ncbi:outer envelope protein 61-like protein [Tanacetum coccineum]